jgi:hypothetical protein
MRCTWDARYTSSSHPPAPRRPELYAWKLTLVTFLALGHARIRSFEYTSPSCIRRRRPSRCFLPEPCFGLKPGFRDRTAAPTRASALSSRPSSATVYELHSDAIRHPSAALNQLDPRRPAKKTQGNRASACHGASVRLCLSHPPVLHIGSSRNTARWATLYQTASPTHGPISAGHASPIGRRPADIEIADPYSKPQCRKSGSSGARMVKMGFDALGNRCET